MNIYVVNSRNDYIKNFFVFLIAVALVVFCHVSCVQELVSCCGWHCMAAGVVQGKRIYNPWGAAT
jgi:hypothetical protein